MEGLPWVEKYRPKSLRDVAYHGEIIAVLGQMMATGELTNILLYGPPGTGKTSTILALVRDTPGCELLELNASDDRGIETIRSQVKSFVSTQKLNSIFKKHKVNTNQSSSLKIVLLDECDALTVQAQMALRRILEQFSAHARFCLVANHINKFIPALLSRCTRFRFSPLPEQQVTAFIRRVAREEKLVLSNKAFDAVASVAAGDLRKAINTLQALHLAALQNTNSNQITNQTHNEGTKEKTSAAAVTNQNLKEITNQTLKEITNQTHKGGTKENTDEKKDANVVGEGAVYAVTGRCDPAELNALYESFRLPGYDQGHAVTKRLVSELGVSILNLVSGLHELVLMDAAKGRWTQQGYTNLVLDLADVERRAASGLSSSILISAVAAAFHLAADSTKK